MDLADVAEMSASAPSTFCTASTAVTMSVCVTVSWSRARLASSSARIASAETRSATTRSRGRIAGAARLDRGVHREHAGLERDFVEPSITLSMPLASPRRGHRPAPPRRRPHGRPRPWRAGSRARRCATSTRARLQPPVHLRPRRGGFLQRCGVAFRRRARSSDACAISPEPVRIVAALSPTAAISASSSVAAALKSRRSVAKSPVSSPSIRVVRSPSGEPGEGSPRSRRSARPAVA